MGFCMISTDDFVFKSYNNVSLAKALEFYESGKADPSMICARLENLTQEFNTSVGTRGAHDKEFIARLQRLGQWFNLIMGKTNTHKSKSKKVREFEGDYGKELKFIYSNRFVDETLTRQRLADPGKFRIMEPLLMAQYNTLPLEELFNSKHLDSGDRGRLAIAKNEKGHYILPLEILEKRLDELPERIKKLQGAIRDLRELSSEYEIEFDETELYLRLQDSIYEQNTFREYLEMRSA